MPNHKDDNSVSRREFLNNSAKSLVGATVVAQCGGLLAGCAKSSSSGSGTTLTPDADGMVAMTFAEYPNLETANGSYQIRVQTSRAVKVINVHNIGGTVKALTAVCPHEGNLVNKWDGTNFTCPSHGSTFNNAGVVTKSPATSNLSAYTVTQSATGVEIAVS